MKKQKYFQKLKKFLILFVISIGSLWLVVGFLQKQLIIPPINLQKEDLKIYLGKKVVVKGTLLNLKGLVINPPDSSSYYPICPESSTADLYEHDNKTATIIGWVKIVTVEHQESCKPPSQWPCIGRYPRIAIIHTEF